MLFMNAHPLLFCILIVVVAACGGKQAEQHDGDHYAEWKEMDEFHLLMAESYHPYRDSSNLDPVKQNAAALLAAANQWASAELPVRAARKEVRDLLSRLQAETSALVERVRMG